MCIIDPGNFFQPGNPEAGEYRIQVDGTEAIHFFKQQEEEKPDIIFGIKQFALIEPATDPVLPEWLFLQRQGLFSLPANQAYRIPRSRHRTADPVHTLIISQVIGDGKADFFQKRETG